MYTWFSDLDSTLIYSHRRKFTCEKILVEYLNGKEQSYMLQKTYDYLCQKKILLVPITMRSVEQYKRVFIFENEIITKYAITCNGAVLLKNGEIDTKWYEETLQIAKKEIKELLKIKCELQGIGTNVKDVEGVMLYFNDEQPKETAMKLGMKYNTTGLDVDYDEKKVYLFPKSINKGTAVKRFRKRFDVDFAIVSGDSKFDVPMLREADIALAPEGIINLIDDTVKKVSLGNGYFISDLLCQQIEKIIKEKTNEFR